VHRAVYWHPQQLPQTTPLRRNISSDVAVVGGGMAGLTCAQVLVERGLSVTLVEQAFCGAGASGRSSGFITPDSELELWHLVANYGEQQGKALWEFAMSGLERIRRTISELGIDCDYQIQDSLLLARTPNGFEKGVRVEHETRRALGYRASLYDRVSLGKIIGARAVHGGVRYDGTFGINSYAYCRALRNELERRGVQIFEGTRATRFAAGGVETPGGTVTAPAIAVLTDRALPDLGLAPAAVYQAQTFLAVSKPLHDRDIRAIFPDDRLMVWDTDLLYHYFRITGEGRLLLGGSQLSSMYSGHEIRSPQRAATSLGRYLARHFPSVTVEIDYIWPGFIGVSKDLAPIVGRHAAFPTVLFAGAAAGLPWAAALGEYLAQKITDRRCELDQTLSAERRFPIGKRVQAVFGKRVSFALSHAATKYLSR
jgi:gamma-glutamylputrescine oxidase